MPDEIHSVYVTVLQPKDATDPGQVTTSYYTLADGVLTMTDSKGAAVREDSLARSICARSGRLSHCAI